MLLALVRGVILERKSDLSADPSCQTDDGSEDNDPALGTGFLARGLRPVSQEPEWVFRKGP